MTDQPIADRSEDVGLTWVGHSTVLLDLAGVRVLTDPLVTPRVAHLRRRRPLPPEGLGRVDVVLISHVHMDHLHLPSLRRLGAAVRLVVPRGAAAWLRRRGFVDVSELAHGEWLELGPLVIRAVQADHPSRRGPHCRLDVPPVGYVVSGGGLSVYFAGDTDLFPGMAELRGVDITLLPIWGWGPTIGEGHLDPERAVTATQRLDQRVVVPVHWGTYSPVRAGTSAPRWLDEPAERFVDRLADSPVQDRLRLLAPGGSLWCPSGAAGPIVQVASPGARDGEGDVQLPDAQLPDGGDRPGYGVADPTSPGPVRRSRKGGQGGSP